MIADFLSPLEKYACVHKNNSTTDERICKMDGKCNAASTENISSVVFISNMFVSVIFKMYNLKGLIVTLCSYILYRRNPFELKMSNLCAKMHYTKLMYFIYFYYLF